MEVTLLPYVYEMFGNGWLECATWPEWGMRGKWCSTPCPLLLGCTSVPPYSYNPHPHVLL